uniref:Thrombospondin-2 n=1 Tax=Sphaerodactylus townsendi TaxID=933632 RepID=A0ACB8GBR0_9SAUR
MPPQRRAVKVSPRPLAQAMVGVGVAYVPLDRRARLELGFPGVRIGIMVHRSWLLWLSILLTFWMLSEAQDGDREDETTFDLLQISNINRKTIGAKVFRGNISSGPAYRFIRFDHIPPVNADKSEQIIKLIQQNEGFILTATLRQDRRSRGTLFSLEGPGISQRQFEIISNGRDNTLELSYWVDGFLKVYPLEDVDLADSHWKNITVQITGENYSLYVGCDLIDSINLEEPFYEYIRTGGNRMYVIKGSIRENHFRVGNLKEMYPKMKFDCQHNPKCVYLDICGG